MIVAFRRPNVIKIKSCASRHRQYSRVWLQHRDSEMWPNGSGARAVSATSRLLAPQERIPDLHMRKSALFLRVVV